MIVKVEQNKTCIVLFFGIVSSSVDSRPLKESNKSIDLMKGKVIDAVQSRKDLGIEEE